MEPTITPLPSPHYDALMQAIVCMKADPKNAVTPVNLLELVCDALAELFPDITCQQCIVIYNAVVCIQLSASAPNAIKLIEHVEAAFAKEPKDTTKGLLYVLLGHLAIQEADRMDRD